MFSISSKTKPATPDPYPAKLLQGIDDEKPFKKQVDVEFLLMALVNYRE